MHSFVYTCTFLLTSENGMRTIMFLRLLRCGINKLGTTKRLKISANRMQSGATVSWLFLGAYLKYNVGNEMAQSRSIPGDRIH
jgi:hypothetical protein